MALPIRCVSDCLVYCRVLFDLYVYNSGFNVISNLDFTSVPELLLIRVRL